MVVTSMFGFGFVGPVGHFWYVFFILSSLLPDLLIKPCLDKLESLQISDHVVKKIFKILLVR